jgi:excisionase family DNA binding protein
LRKVYVAQPMDETLPEIPLEPLEPLVYSIPGAAKALDVSEVTVRRLIWSGDLPARKVGGQWRILRAEVERHLTITS